MTDEAQGHNAENAPARPASTRWSEDPVQDDDALAPPYVPGRSTPAASTSDDFPFDQFDIDGDGEVAHVEETVSDSGDRGWSPADLEDEDPADEWTRAYDVDDSSALDAELEPVLQSDTVEEAEPIESAEWEPETEPGSETDARFEPDGTIDLEVSSEDHAAEEVASVLDRLARLLREDGEAAVRREMDSSDRLTALVSSLVSGHLSGRR